MTRIFSLALLLMLLVGCSDSADETRETFEPFQEQTTGSTSPRPTATFPPPAGRGVEGEWVERAGVRIRVRQHFFDPCDGTDVSAPPGRTYLVADAELENVASADTVRYGALDVSLRVAGSDELVGPVFDNACHGPGDGGAPLRIGVTVRPRYVFEVAPDVRGLVVVFHDPDISIDLGE